MRVHGDNIAAQELGGLLDNAYIEHIAGSGFFHKYRLAFPGAYAVAQPA